MYNTNYIKSAFFGFIFFLIFRYNLIKQYLKSINIKQILITIFTEKRIITIILAIFSYIIYIVLGLVSKILSYFFLYQSIILLVMVLPDKKPFKKIRLLASALHFISLLLDPIFRFLFAISYVFLVPLAMSLLLFHAIPELILQIDLTLELKVYLAATFSSIFIVLRGEKIASRITADEYKPKERARKQTEFTLSFVNKDVIKYLIYSSFFLSLLIFSITQFSNTELISGKDIGTPLLRAFVTFIAFDRLIQNSNLMNINLKKSFKKLWTVWETYE